MEHRPEIESFAFGKAEHRAGAGNSQNAQGTSQKQPAGVLRFAAATGLPAAPPLGHLHA